jgi:hypothetical protein
MNRRISVPALALAAALMLGAAAVAAADTTTTTANGTWTAHPGQTTNSQTSVQQPINADGSSNFKANGKGVIPVKFSLSQGLGAFVFESIYSNTTIDDDFSFLSFAPSATTTFAQVATLASNYAFTLGDCHGGSLRWQVRTAPAQAVFIYYGGYPNFGNGGLDGCSGANNQSGLNLIGMPDLRYDLQQYGGPFYGSYADAIALVGANTPITRATLALDSGWQGAPNGDQRLTLSSATVNGDTFTPSPATGLAPTCNLPAATIRITKTSGLPSGAVNEPETVQPNDNDGNFRVVDCKYMYNLATSSLSGVGTYKVELLIGGVPATGAATFDLR